MMPASGADLHPTLRRRLGAAAETVLLIGTIIAIWISDTMVLLGAIIAAFRD